MSDSPNPHDLSSKTSPPGYPTRVLPVPQAIGPDSDNSLYDCTVIIDCNGRISYFSALASAVTGYNQTEVIGKHFTGVNIIAPEFLALAIAKFENVLDGISLELFEFDVISKLGERIHMEAKSSPLYRDSSICAIQLTARDISERKRYENALSAQSRYLASMIGANDMRDIARLCFDFITNMIPCRAGALNFVTKPNNRHDLETAYYFYSDENKNKIEPEKLEPISPDDFNVFDNIMVSKSVTFSFDSERFAGHPLPSDQISHKTTGIRTIHIPLLNRDGVFGILSVQEYRHDSFTAANRAMIESMAANLAITLEAARFSNALKISQEKYRSLYDNAMVGLFRSRLSDGKILDFNQAMMEKLGFNDPKEFIENFYFSDHYAIPSQRREMLRILRTSGEIENYEVPMVMKDGTIIWVKIAARANFDQDYLEGVAVDITAQKAAEQQIKDMARFPQENPSPVLRIDKNGIITYANAASGSLLSLWNSPIGKQAPGEIIEIIAHTLKTGIVIESELNYDDQIYSFLFSPSLESGDVNIYGRNITERIAGAKAILASEENYRTIFNAVNDAVFAHDPITGTIIDVNDRMCEMFGFERDEILGSDFNVITGEQNPYLARESSKYLESAANGIPQLFDWRTSNKAGRQFWVEVNLKKAIIGGRDCLLAVVRDIDHRKRIEQLQEAIFRISESISSTENLSQLLNTIHNILGELIDTTDFYIALYDNATDNYTFPYLVKPNGDNDYSTRPLKKRITDYVRRTGISLLAKEDTFERLTAEGEIDLTGIPCPKVWLGVPLKTTDGVIGVVAVQSYENGNVYNEKDLELLEYVSKYLALAISRKQAGEALRLSEEKYRSLVYAVPDGIVITDLEENIKYINPAACEIMGYSFEELIDINLSKIIHPEDYNYVRSQTEKRKALERSRYHFKIINKNQQLRKVYISAAPILDGTGKVVFTMGIFRDVTDIEIAEREKQDLRDKLARAQRMESLGLLAGGVAHDLNNMLGPLVAYPELIRMKLPPDSPILDKITKIETSAQRAAGVVQDLLTMARRGRYEMSPLYFNEIIRAYFDSSDFYALKQRNSDVEIDMSLADDNPVVLGSNSHLSKMVMNLVINAFDAMPHGGKLRIGTQCRHIDRLADGYDNIDAGLYAMLTIADTGTGIDPKDIKRIFEPFYTKKQLGRSGSGLGLSIVYGVIKDHNGYIDVRSELNNGSEFTIYLPILDKTPGQQTTPAVDIHGSETILVVDDTIEQRELAQVILTSLGYQVYVAANGREGIEMLRKQPADLIVLDMIMDGDFDGLDTYKEMIKIRPGQKAIITSGYAETDRVKEAERLGVGKYIRKPYTLQKLGRTIRELLD
jgi:PAS domain S-box-containing protein